MAQLLKGRDLSLVLKNELKEKVNKLSFTPKLGVVLVGDDPASRLYVSLKEKAAIEVGIAVEKKLLQASASTDEVRREIELFNQRQDIHGILVQLPLPKQINESEIISSIDPAKDADGFHPANLAKLKINQETVIPGVSSGIMKLIDLSQQPLTNKHALLIVNSEEFALPLKILLERRGAIVTTANQVNSKLTLSSDIIIIALGQANSLKSLHIKDQAIIIDVGTNKINDKIVGDVAGDELVNRPIYLSPVPGGVGPMTVIMLLWNVLYLAEHLAVSPIPGYTNK